MFTLKISIAAIITLAATQISATVYERRDGGYGGASGSRAKWGRIKTLVAFGDSYTDEGRLNYMIAHKGEAPPLNWIPPESAINSTASGGKTWPRFVTQSTGIELHNYAVSGAVCSNDLTPRYLPYINNTFPAINDYEIPTFTSELTSPNHKPLFDPETTLFSIWIGTNDLGADLIISGLPTVGEVNYTDCVFSTIEKLYSLGARNFVLQNLAPLQYAPLYASVADGGSEGPDRYWPDREGNATLISWRMRDLVESSNMIFRWRAEGAVKGLSGASIAVFDSYSLMLDIYHSPENYLNGSLPLNVTGYNIHCNANSSECFTYRPDDRDSFFWYDELHPSEQVNRVIAREFVETIKGVSKYATFW
ncbi:hypothetical protein RUND412_011132 [Rhizina undulata]